MLLCFFFFLFRYIRILACVSPSYLLRKSIVRCFFDSLHILVLMSFFLIVRIENGVLFYVCIYFFYIYLFLFVCLFIHFYLFIYFFSDSKPHISQRYCIFRSHSSSSLSNHYFSNLQIITCLIIFYFVSCVWSVFVYFFQRFQIPPEICSSQLFNFTSKNTEREKRLEINSMLLAFTSLKLLRKSVDVAEIS